MGEIDDWSERWETEFLLFFKLFSRMLEDHIAEARETAYESSRRALGRPSQHASLSNLNLIWNRYYLQYLRYSIVTSGAARLEVFLTEYCDALGRELNLAECERIDRFKSKNRNRSPLAKPEQFIRKHLGMFDDWESVWENANGWMRIRNCVLHAGGELTKLKRKQRNKLKTQLTSDEWAFVSIEQILIFQEDYLNSFIRGFTKIFELLDSTTQELLEARLDGE